MKNILIIYVERIVQVVVGLLISYFVINYFTSNEYGIYKYIMSIVNIFVIFILLGFNIANVRYIPEYLINNTYSKINYQILVFTTIQIFILGISLLLFWYFYTNEYFKLNNNIEIIYLLLLVILNYMKSYFAESLLVAFSKRILLTYIRIVLYIIQFVIIYISIMQEVNIKEFIEYIVFYSFIETFILVITMLKVYKEEISTFHIKKFNLSKPYAVAINNYGFSIVNFFRDNAITIVVVSYLFDYTEVAYYSVALIIPNMIRSFTPSKIFAGLLIPEFVAQYNKTKKDLDIFNGINFISKINLIFLIPAIIYSVFLYQFIIENYFSLDYANNTNLLAIILFINILFLSYLDLNILLSNILEKSHLVLKINILSISNILFLFLFHSFGRYSIGISNLISTFFTVIVFWFVLRNIYNMKIEFNFFNKNILFYSVILLISSFLIFNINIYLYMILFPIIVVVGWLILVKTTFFLDFEKEFIFNKLIKNKKLRGYYE